jgi:hypothetical protein
MDPKSLTAETGDVEVTETILNRDKECKHSVRFTTGELDVPVDNVYVARSMPGITTAKKIAITVRVVE